MNGHGIRVCHSRDREAWLDARRTGIGASETAVIMGDSHRSSPLEIYVEKVTGQGDDLEGDFVEAGQRLEPVVLEWFGDRTGSDVEADGWLFRSPESEWALATCDGWARFEGEWIPLEAKTTGAFMANEWADGPPVYYWWQCQQQCYVHGAPRAAIACLIGGQRFVWDIIERDDSAIARMVRTCGEFWRRVLAEDPPAPDASPATTKALNRLYPQEDGSDVALGGELIDVSDEIDRLRVERREMEHRIKFLENEIKASIGEATRGVLPDGSEWTWKRVDMPEQVRKATSFRRLYRRKPKGV